MRLIDADKAIGRYYAEWEKQDISDGAQDRDWLKQCIDEAPAIDAVPVVRCKDCVSHGNCLTEDTFRIARIENSYCCGGKRKEADNEVLES